MRSEVLGSKVISRSLRPLVKLERAVMGQWDFVRMIGGPLCSKGRCGLHFRASREGRGRETHSK